MYCSEPSIAFNKTVVLGYRIQLEAKHLAPATINLRLAAVRRLAYEAADIGCSAWTWRPVFGVKGAKRLRVRLGNWLNAQQAKELLRSPNREALIGKRDCAIVAICLRAGCVAGIDFSEAGKLRRDENVSATPARLHQIVAPPE